MQRNTQPRRTQKILKRVFLYFVSFVVCICVLSCGSLYYIFLRPPSRMPSYREACASYIKSEAVLFDRNGKVLHEMRIDEKARRLDWTPLKDISPALQSAIIAGEDHRFYQHRGVDWIAFSSAAINRIVRSRARGASTISMQLAAILNEDLRADGARRSVFQKLRQMRAARLLEKTWSKAEILEAYLNLVTYRGELQGISAAARGLFAKEPQGANDIEATILTALVRSPNAGIDAVRARACALSQTMKLACRCTQISEAVNHTLSRPYYVRPAVSLAPHVALQLLGGLAEDGQKRSRTASCTLDRNLQAFAAESLRHHVLSARSKNMHDGAALVVDNRSGDVLAYVGNIGDQSSARYVDGIRAMRQAGSTLKPFIYALAFDQRILTPASLVDDSPLDIPVIGGVYRPRNYDNHFHGMVTARTALASSLNVPAVKALNLIGIHPFIETMQRLNFRNMRDPDYYGLSVALGSADITLSDLVNAYRALANGGVWSPLHLAPEKAGSSPLRIVSREAAFLVSDILSDRESRSRTFSLESPLSTRYWTAVKTGTSKDMRDNWCVGFSDRYTVGIWAGNFSGEPMWNVSGITGAAPVWIDIMNYLHRKQSSRAPAQPEGVIRQIVEFASLSDRRQEWFIKGTEAGLIQQADVRVFPKIVYPTAGTIVALDPDIPPEDQKVFFEAKADGSNLEWILDGQSIGSATTLLPWSPLKGRHILKLLDAGRQELDSVSFEVRGNDRSISDYRYQNSD